MQQDDLLWKALLEDIFDYFLLFFFKEDAHIFDIERGFEFLDKELDQLFPEQVEGTNGLRFVDKLVKVYTTEGEEKWMLVHVEVQGYNDPDFAKRMFTYFYRILDRYNKPVTCMAIFTDNNRNYVPNEYHYKFVGVENIFRYNVYKIIEQNAATLAESDNPFALVILTALVALQRGKKLEEELVPLKISIAQALFKKAIPAKKVRAIMNFLRYYVHFDKPENNSKFEEVIDIITGKKQDVMGIEEYLLQRAKKEGIEEAREEKNIAFVKSLLINTNFDDEKIAVLASVTVAFVQEIKEQSAL